jgi:hypothetical protein
MKSLSKSKMNDAKIDKEADELFPKKAPTRVNPNTPENANANANANEPAQNANANANANAAARQNARVNANANEAVNDVNNPPPAYESLDLKDVPLKTRTEMAIANSLEEVPDLDVPPDATPADAAPAGVADQEPKTNLAAPVAEPEVASEEQKLDLGALNEIEANSQIDLNKNKRNQYKLDRQRAYAAKMDAKNRAVSALVSIITASGKLADAMGQNNSANANANAAAIKAIADFLTAKAQNAWEFGSDTSGTIGSVNDLMNVINNDRHKATDAIWG